jgi:KipI family sensor histidine kinase inhibitor
VKYDEPKYLPGGDQTMLIEFGNELSLDLIVFTQRLGRIIDDQDIKGIVETVPFIATFLIHYDPDKISFEDLHKEMASQVESLEHEEEAEIDSRLMRFPTVYLDPWTAEAMAKYRAEINPDKEKDPELIARLNGLEDVDEFVRVHSGTDYWCAALGFWPGAAFLMPLDPRCRLLAPKYNPPRTFTHRGTVGLAGGLSGIYPVDGPGGYQIFARTPVPIWDAQQRLADFEEQPWLVRPTDRIRFVPCSVEEFEEIDRKVADGTYRIDISDYETVSLRDYRE